MTIDSELKYQRRHQAVHGRSMSYIDEGDGDSILFLHGNPTSAYLWRNVIPHLLPMGRCVAPELIGMGQSDKLPDSGPDSYTFAEHRRYLDGLLEKLDLGDRVLLVVHDWGSALGFDWARRHPDRVRGIAYMEAIVCPVEWDDWPEQAQGIFQAFRSPKGDELVLERNFFVERVLPSSIIRELSTAEMDAYRTPFAAAGEDRRPTLSWPRQIPVGGEPADVVEIVNEYQAFLAQTPIPKLFINAEPGSILVGRQRELCRRWPNQREVTVKGLHFIQEDSPDEIGAAVAKFAADL